MKRPLTVFIIIMLLGAAGYFAYYFIMQWHKESIEEARSRLRSEMESQETPDIPEQKIREAFGDTPSGTAEAEGPDRPDEVERRVKKFFSYLDSRDYVQEYGLEGGTREEFRRVMEELSSNPPLVAGETESLHTLYKNMAHFARVLGMRRINLVRDFMNNEPDIIESAMQTFYRWFTMETESGKRPEGRPSLEVLYEYSGFFLHTLAGRSYLLRRPPKIRVLTSYYCVRILDRANDAELNRYGIDIRPHIRTLQEDMDGQKQLIYKKQYLSELEQLSEKYRL